MVVLVGIVSVLKAVSVGLDVWKVKAQGALIVAQRERIDDLECALEMASALAGDREAVVGHGYNMQTGGTLKVKAPDDYTILVTRGPTTLTVGPA